MLLWMSTKKSGKLKEEPFFSSITELEKTTSDIHKIADIHHFMFTLFCFLEILLDPLSWF